MKIISYIGKLIQNNTGYSSKNFFLFTITMIGALLLIVPIIVLLVEVFANHTIQTSLDGFAQYIASVATLFATAGITKAWSEMGEHKSKKERKKKTEMEEEQ